MQTGKTASGIAPGELQKIAWILVDRHGQAAFDLAGDAAIEMQELGDHTRTSAWLALQAVIDDALNGLLPRAKAVSIH